MFPMSGWKRTRLLMVAWAALLLFLGSPDIALSQDAEATDSAPKEEKEEASEDEDLQAQDLSAYLDVDTEDVNSEIDDRYKGVEEILVTSQAGGANLQDLGVSVAAFDADYLEALGADSIADIAQFTPNLEIRTVFAASNPTLFIRGVGLRDFNANSSSSVAVYNDDVYMNSPAGQLSQLFDVQQVEVLRGPQGTLYGRNASAGAIRVISRKPTGDVNGYTNFTYGNYSDIQAEAAVETPITDTLTTRLSGTFHTRDGTTKNRCGDPQFKDRRPAPPNGILGPGSQGVLDFNYLVHGQYANINPGTGQSTDPNTNPYGQSGGCFNRDTMAPITPISSQYDSTGRTGLGWTPGWVDVPGAADNPAPGPPNVDLWVNQIDNWAVRGLLRWQPSDVMDWVLNVHGGMNNGGGRQFQVIGAGQRPDQERPDLNKRDTSVGYFDPDLQYYRPYADGPLHSRDIQPRPPSAKSPYWYHTDPAGGNPYEGDYNINEPETLRLYGTSLSGDMRLQDTLLFKSISAFEGNERYLVVNLDGGPFQNLEPILSNESWQLSQEFKLIWEAGEGFNAEVGAVYLYEYLHTHNEFELDPLTNYAIQDYSLTTKYASAYGWMSWAPVEDFSIVAGGRINYEKKVMDLSTTKLNPITGQEALPTQYIEEEVSDTGVSGDISFNYNPTDEHLVFFKYSRGYKGPHINGGVLNGRTVSEEGELLTTPVKPEKVDSLELGIKTAWLDNTLTVNGAVFYYDYENIQIFQLRNTGSNDVPTQQLINANDADIFGAEIEIRAQPLYGYPSIPEEIQGLELFASFGWLNSHYTNFTQTLTTVLQEGELQTNTFDFSGNRLINSPEFAFAGYAAWPWVTSVGTLAVRYDWTYKSAVFFGPENDPNISEDELWLMNIRLSYATPDSGVEVAGWIRNVTDQAYSADILNLTRFNGSILHAIGDPRTFGVTVQVRF